uniref:Uncharacterized protein n=1 Tax=Macrostomum lignano TaxID=282301 RepID=A0A1I8FJK5_9PLAT
MKRGREFPSSARNIPASWCMYRLCATSPHWPTVSPAHRDPRPGHSRQLRFGDFRFARPPGHGSAEFATHLSGRHSGRERAEASATTDRPGI